MKLNLKNTYIAPHEERYSVFIEMPDGSRNYLHSKTMDLESSIITQDLINELDIDHMNLIIRKDESYFRLVARLKNVNGDIEEFHSRKLNLNDILHERWLLVNSD